MSGGGPMGYTFDPTGGLPACVISIRASQFMYIHLFAFRWKPDVTDDQKDHVINEILELQGQIPGLLETWVGKNLSPRGQGYELGGAMKFADKASLDAYGPHPVHQKLVSWLMPMIEPIEVDFAA